MDSRDENYEVLDPGATEGPSNPRVDGLPALDLGERTTGPGDEPDARAGRTPMPAWQRWAATAVALVVGVFAGAYVWHARSESAEIAAEEEEVALVAGRVTGALITDQFNLPQPPRRLVVELHNAGARDVGVSDVRLPGWRLSGATDPSSTKTVPSGEWTRFGLEGEPACVDSVPEYVEVDVRTDAGDSSVVVPLPPDDSQRGLRLDYVYSLACPDVAPRQIVADAINVRRSAANPEILQMGVQLLVPGPEAQITAVDGSAAGLRGEGTDLPVPAGGSRRSATVSVDWRVDSCADTAGLTEVTLDLELAEDGDATEPVVLSNRAVAVLARFAAEECGT